LIIIAEKYRKIWKALQNPKRIDILKYLKMQGSQNYTTIWRGLENPCAYKNIIEHIKILEQAKLVKISNVTEPRIQKIVSLVPF